MIPAIRKCLTSCGWPQYLSFFMIAILAFGLGALAHINASLLGLVREPDIVTNVEMKILDNPVVRGPDGKRFIRTWRKWDASETCLVFVGRVLITARTTTNGAIFAPWTMLDVPATRGEAGHHEVERMIEIPDSVQAGDYLYSTVDPHTECVPSGRSQLVLSPPLPVTLGE